MSGRMPFGRYRGRLLSEVPDAYLKWLYGIELDEPLRASVAREWARRSAGGVAPKRRRARREREAPAQPLLAPAPGPAPPTSPARVEPREKRCADCGGGLLHEFVYFLAVLDETTRPMCPSCAESLVARLRKANAEAGDVLERFWNAS
jgi:hypothetical protein